ncbi:hypothetical protein DFR56_116114 [Pseudogracilibacillus auburnensis]|uniref:Uncharacterized protein n=1 Tax=Pseudogracilibacillus auburnensis TaxID=1494959 RepID=A0A2V3VTU8_9BACI|nr:hypothetical protein DFR56_116114 [Pseudogracilibacillus auburnensis]
MERLVQFAQKVVGVVLAAFPFSFRLSDEKGYSIGSSEPK